MEGRTADEAPSVLRRKATVVERAQLAAFAPRLREEELARVLLVALIYGSRSLTTTRSLLLRALLSIALFAPRSG